MSFNSWLIFLSGGCLWCAGVILFFVHIDRIFDWTAGKRAALEAKRIDDEYKKLLSKK